MHTFAVRTLVNWHRTGKDPAHTYWYIESVPELLELASRRVAEVLS
jgi:integrase/recombinase XerD